MKAIFLDRDGTLNQDIGYLHSLDQLIWIPGTFAALRRLQSLGFLLFVVTNQSGVARGLYSEQDVIELHKHMAQILESEGIQITDWAFCPHHPKITGSCFCRKPQPGMLFNLAQKHHIDINQSFIVGDTLQDQQASSNANCAFIPVLSGKAPQDLQNQNLPCSYNTLWDWVQTL